MITLPSDEEIISMTEFPYLEGTCIEYKKSIKDKFKIEATLCAFLNTDGGYLICGIFDDRKINWLELEEKEIDYFLAKIDSLTSNRVIRLSNGDAIHHDAIKARVVKNKENKYIIILSANRKSGFTYTYQGNIIYRLNVSNFYSTSVPTYTVAEVSLMKQQLTAELKKVYEPEIKKSSKIILRLEKTNIMLERSFAKKEKEYIDILFEKILAEKEAKEKEMMTSVCSIFWFLCGC